MTSDTVPEPIAPPVGLPHPGSNDPDDLALLAGLRVEDNDDDDPVLIRPDGERWGWPGGRPATASLSIRAAFAPVAGISRRRAVSAGWTSSQSGLSSQVTIDRSAGTRTPIRWAAPSPATAITSLSYTIAVGGSVRFSRF